MRVVIAKSAQKEIERLPDDVLPRVQERILSLRDDPLPKGVKKLATSDGFRLRVGDYRVIYGIDKTNDSVVVTRVRHRREVYRWRA